MKTSLLVSIVSASFLLNACAPKKGEEKSQSPASADAADASKAIEHCNEAAAKACFVEVAEDGRSTFFTTDKYQQNWLTNEGLAQSNITPVIVTEEEYQYLVTTDIVPRAVYDRKVAVDFNVATEDGAVAALPGRDANARFALSGISRIFKGKKLAGPKTSAGVGPGRIGGLFSKLKGLKPTPGMKSGGKKLWNILFGGLGGITVLGGVLGGVNSIEGWIKKGMKKPEMNKNGRGDVTGSGPVEFNFGSDSFVETVDLEQ